MRRERSWTKRCLRSKRTECCEKGKWSAASSKVRTEKRPGFSDMGTFDEQ